jgi:ABC-type proline/glycine betaine transport system permease subunit
MFMLYYTSSGFSRISLLLNWNLKYLDTCLKKKVFYYTLFVFMVHIDNLQSRNWFVMQGPVAIILISWNVNFIWETGYWTRAMKRFALFDLLKSLYSDTNILSKYIPSL